MSDNQTTAAKPELNSIKLAVFDMDSTLIEQEVIDELARFAGVGEKVAQITARAMAGELDFEASLRARVALLKGLEASALEDVQKIIRPTNGAHELIAELKRRSVYTAVVSGGFVYFAGHVARVLGLDEAFANELEIENGRLTGRLLNKEVVDAGFKERTLVQLCKRLGIHESASLAVGDGANDIPMIRRAGVGIAFNAKEKVQQAARFAVNGPSLLGVLSVFR